MVEIETVPQLQALGFTEYEAKAYVALLQAGPLTGYQIAKASGIPRPNIYPLLERLEQRGALTRVETDGRLRYRAVPAADLLRDLSRNYSAQLGRAEEALANLRQPAAPEAVRNLQGYDTVLGAAENLITSAKHELLLALGSPESARLASTLDKAHRRGVDISTLCIEGCARECGDCRGRQYRYPIAPDPRTRWLVIASDERELLVGQATAASGASAVLTRLEGIVAVGGQYVRNTIALAELVRNVGGRLPEVADDAAIEALRLAANGPGGTWLESMTAEGSQ
jgi:HTH-type transcriptional regulator, sugar sensing transcriptional regulator